MFGPMIRVGGSGPNQARADNEPGGPATAVAARMACPEGGLFQPRISRKQSLQ